jgi:predicted nucleic acid-binding protein
LILADTSLWIDHLRQGNAELGAWLEAGEVLIHPCVIGELALGNLADRDALLRELGRLPRTAVASAEEVLALISLEKLHGSGLGYVDASLLAAVRLTPESALRTRDRRLQAAADRLAADA